MSIEKIKQAVALNEHLFSRMKEKQESWFRHLSILLSTLLGIIVSLADKTGDNPAHHFCMAFGVSSLCIALLLSLILLFYKSTWLSNKEFATYREQLKKVDMRSDSSEIVYYSTSLPSFLVFVEALDYLSIASAFVAFAVSFWVE